MATYTDCEDCKHSVKGLKEFPCTVCIHNATERFEPKSNADRIRNMTDEELAEFIYFANNDFGDKKLQELKEWLQLESKI